MIHIESMWISNKVNNIFIEIETFLIQYTLYNIFCIYWTRVIQVIESVSTEK